MLKTKIKASAVSNLTDARYFAAREVEWLGIPLGQDLENAVAPVAAKAFIEWVDGVKIVGEFGFAEAATIRELHGQLRFDAVQVGMFTPLEEVARLDGLTVVKEMFFEKNASETDLAEHLRQFAACDYFLLNFEKTGITWEDVKTGKPFSVETLRMLCEKYPIILALDFSPENVDEILTEINPHGLNLAGGEEEKVGFKSFDELDEILDALALED